MTNKRPPPDQFHGICYEARELRKQLERVKKLPANRAGARLVDIKPAALRLLFDCNTPIPVICLFQDLLGNPEYPTWFTSEQIYASEIEAASPNLSQAEVSRQLNQRLENSKPKDYRKQIRKWRGTRSYMDLISARRGEG